MKVLITGVAGFIGSHLAEKLYQKGYEIYGIDNLSTGRIENLNALLNKERFRFVVGSVTDKAALEKLIIGSKYVYHLAAAVGVKMVIENSLEALRVNIQGTENILEVANKEKPKVLISSSSEVYGKASWAPLKEDDDRITGSTRISRWGYACSKAVDEFLALAYYREKKLPIVIVRLFNICGPRQVGDYGMVIPRFIKQALLGHPITVFGSGNQKRCFSYIEDAVDALIKLMESNETTGEIYNVGSDEEISIEELALKIKEMTRTPSKIEHIPYEKAYERGFEDMERRLPSLEKIKKAIGYQPKTSLTELLEKTIEYFKK
jgi:UDP-glucose 4-epimerase